MLTRLSLVHLLLLALLLNISKVAYAYTVGIGTGSGMLYLRVGDGASTQSGDYSFTPLTGGAVSEVSATISPENVGNGVQQAMSGNGSLRSDWGFRPNCPAGSVYTSMVYRSSSSILRPTAQLRVSSPASLVSLNSDIIPISQIGWTSSESEFSSGSFTGGSQTLMTTPIANGTFRETCYSFFYKNTTTIPAGTYQARVTYTLSAP